jgi:hypothetical protein
MLLTDHVSLTSLTSSVTTRELMIVASAIQKQVTRDFGPNWGIRATVDAFADLTDVPSDYYHVVVFTDTEELVDRLAAEIGDAEAEALVGSFDSDQISGIHLNAWTRQPFALVQAVDEAWTTVCSHEVLEVLADPYGNRLVAASHPFDARQRVKYLLEICDPCQQISYTVNGIGVSDFYTPRYFDPVRNDVTRFSFTGELRYPLEILEGGYLSFIDEDDAGLYQIGRDGEARMIANLRTLSDATRTLRTIVDGDPITPRPTAASIRWATGAVAAQYSGDAVRSAARGCGHRTARAIYGLTPVWEET